MQSKNGTHKLFVTLGATSHSAGDRANDDYYATDPRVVEELLKYEKFSNNIWEPACGEGHISKALERNGYNVLSTDLVDRGFGRGGCDFLAQTQQFDGDIITNPPYKYALEFVRQALNLVPAGHKVAMLLRLQFLEGKSRRQLFDSQPPTTVYVSSSRISCCKNGDFRPGQTGYSSAQAYAWFIWTKGFSGDPVIKWFN